jgi:hypothetical protein
VRQATIRRVPSRPPPRPAPVQKAKAAALPPPVATPPAAPPVAPPAETKPKDDCSPPYYWDGSKKVFKTNCL